MATSTDLRAAIDDVQEQLDQGVVGEQLGISDDSINSGEGQGLYERAGALPWWVISSIVHSVLFLLAALITVSVPAANQEHLVIRSSVIKKEPPKYDPQKKRAIFKNEVEVMSEQQVEKPVVVHEDVEVTDHFETDDNMDMATAAGREDAISDIPLGGTGSTGSMGVGASGGLAGRYGYRGGGGRKRAVARYGGSPATESAVEAALRWLARHQEKDGHWDWRKHLPPGGGAYSEGGQVGVTGLAMLAFLGAGHTGKSGPFRDNVRRAQAWLISKQDARTGEIKAKKATPHARSYNHPMAALALVEAYGMTKDYALKDPAEKALNFVVAWQNPGAGWRYGPRDGNNDPSVTGWMLMVAKSGKIAGFKVPASVYSGGLSYLNLSTYKKGSKAGKTHYRYGNGSSYGRWESMTSVSIFCRLLMGFSRNEPLLKKQADWLSTAPPDWEKSNDHTSHSEYYWYYGTLAMFQMGGKYWKDWNKAMKPTLVNNQRKGGPMNGSVQDVDGSWDPYSRWGKYGGRVYTTAINALSLEVYYRYLPLYAR
jgi:hypothetical protein